jgi:tetratricopeptide (TPR) repeat protein
LLAAFFALWSLIFYVHYARKNNRGFYLGSFAMYFLALMSKPTSVPIPAVMLLMDYWPLRRIPNSSTALRTSIEQDIPNDEANTNHLLWDVRNTKCEIRCAIIEKLPLFVVGGLFAVITYISQSRTVGTRSPGEFGFERVFLVLCHNIIFYLYKIGWPVNLSSHYAFPQPLSLSQPMVLAGVIGTFILISLLALLLHWTRAAATGWLIFFVAILPTMQIVGFSDVIASDKFAYLPSAGLLMILTSFLIWLCRTSYVAESTILRVILVVTMLIPAGFESVATRRHLVYWRDSVSLYEHMLAITPDSASLHNGLGNAFYSQGRVSEAINQYQEALRIEPGEAETYNNIGVALLAEGRMDDALNCFQKSLSLRPKGVSALNNIAWILVMHPDHRVRDVNQAVSLAESAAELTHYEDIFVLNTLMLTYAAVDRFEDAINVAQKALVFASAAGDSEQAAQLQGQIEALKEQKAEKEEANP